LLLHPVVVLVLVQAMKTYWEVEVTVEVTVPLVLNFGSRFINFLNVKYNIL
jgi:hypothetical protein